MISRLMNTTTMIPTITMSRTFTSRRAAEREVHENKTKIEVEVSFKSNGTHACMCCKNMIVLHLFLQFS